MPLPRGSGSFLQGFGSGFPQHDVVIVHDAGKPSEKRTKSRAILQSCSGIFDLDAPIYEGDTVEAPDPRGGTRVYYVGRVDITDTNGAAVPFEGMSHVTAAWRTMPHSSPAPQSISSSDVYNAPVINIHGNRAQVAWGDHTAAREDSGATSTVAQGYEEIAKAVAAMLQHLQFADINEDDREIAIESAEDILKAVTAKKPDSKILRRGLATIKGILGGLASGAATSANDAAHDWTQSGLSALTSLSMPT